MAGYERHLAEFDELDVRLFAASVDPLDKAEEVAADLSFPIGFGVGRDIADTLDSWWEERRGLIQPSEFILNAQHKAIASTYSSGPVGRVDAEDAIRIIKFFESRK